MTAKNHRTTFADCDRVIALAGILQSAYLVDQIASKGIVEKTPFNASLNSLFYFDADTASDIYGGVAGVKCGLTILGNILRASSIDNYRNCIRYSLAILHLQKKLSKDNALLDIIRQRLEHTEKKAAHYTDNSNGIAASCAGIYQDTISTYKYRIQINGDMQQLQNTDNVDKIRALLLAGIRSAVLWRQLGGRRWQLILSRKSVLNTVNHLLSSSTDNL